MSEINADTSKIKENEKSTTKEKYPKIVFLIILNEFCERFSYYGLRTVLFLYLTGFIKLEQHSATAIYHAFTVLCYFSPIIGAVIADGFLGLFRTILYVSIIYAIGELILTLTSMVPLGAPNLIGPAIALIIIGLGTGGIKPCVSAFGGNQFKPSQKKYLETFFSIFYLSINIGSTIGTILTPIFRNDVKCFGNDCYPLAFGVPAGFMVLSIISFFVGRSYYNRNDEKLKEGKNIIIQTIGCFFTGLKNRIIMRNKVKKEHWLDYADTKYSPKMISDVKAFYGVLKVFLPLPVFWALYDQQGSRWTSQAQQLNGRIGSFTIKPDQFQALNPILIVIFVPIFDYIIYPFLAKFNLFKSYLQRIGVGLIFAILSFIIAAILELYMQKATLALNPNNRVRIVNISPCNLKFYTNELQTTFDVESFNKNANNMPNELVNILQNKNDSNLLTKSICFNNKEILDNLFINAENLPKTILIYMENNKLKSLDIPYNNKKQIIGFSQVKIAYFNITNNFGNLNPSISNKIIEYPSSKFTIQNLQSISESNSSSSSSSYTEIDYAEYKFYVKNENGEELLKSNILLETCGTYTILLYSNPFKNASLEYIFLVDVHPNGIHLAWQIIQILVMAVGEIMYAISGLSFAYSQAPESMKSATLALWNLTSAFGNLIIVFIAEAQFVKDQVYEYILFAGLLGIATIIFIILAWFYKNREPDQTQEKEPFETENKKESNKQEHQSKFIVNF